MVTGSSSSSRRGSGGGSSHYFIGIDQNIGLSVDCALAMLTSLIASASFETIDWYSCVMTVKKPIQ